MRSFCFSLLFFYVVLSELYLGALAALCFRALVPTKWLEPLAPALLKLQKLGLVLAPLFLLVAAAVPELYPWAVDTVSGTPFRRFYLSQGGFLLRGIFYWALWTAISRAAQKKKAWAGGPGLVLLFLTGTFAAVDWVLSLEPQFGSTIFGMVFFLSCLLLAFGLAAFVSAERSSPGERQDQGSVHLALICTWTYLSFMQFLVVWSGNLPNEVRWYQLRSGHGWALLPAAFGLCQFFLPMLLLVQSPLKRSPFSSRALALLSVVLQTLFCYWQILPELRAQLSLSASDLLVGAALLVGGYLFARGPYATA